MHQQKLSKILHIDMDAFYASVEQRDFPELRGKPVIVGGKAESRGVVAACSYEARKFGVHSAMPSAQAAKLCKHAIFKPPRFDAYREASRGIHQVFRKYTSLIEPLSLDEAYLDVTQAAQEIGSATEVAQKIKLEIYQSVKLRASAGVSFNKFLAKIASDMDKPDGLYVIRPEAASAFVEQLEIRKFFGVGKITEKRMHALGIYTGADLKKLSEVQLQTEFGATGSYYYQVARGVDKRPVRASRQRKSLGNETTFEHNLLDKKEIWQTLQNIASTLEGYLQNKSLLAYTLTLKLRYSDFTIITRSKTRKQPYVSCEDICAELPELLRKTEVGRRPIRLIGITLAKLASAQDNELETKVSMDSSQLGLF